jgi:hypothetical protein
LTRRVTSFLKFFGSLAFSTAIVSGCGRKLEPVPAGPVPLVVNFDHLRHLGLDAVVAGRPVRVVSLYAEAPDYLPTASPARDGFEGIASLDDAARATVAYLHAYEQTADPRARDEALKLLAFVVAMEQGDGEFVNFIDANGRLNRNAESSHKSMSFWAARSIWARSRPRRFRSGQSIASSSRPCRCSTRPRRQQWSPR